MLRTSDITFTDVNHKHEIYNLNYYKDNYTVVYEKGWTDYLLACPTRYSPVTYCYRGDNIIGVSLAYYGEYTESELGFLRNFLNSESIVYDVGANIGVHAQAFAKSSKHVYAFEPNDLNRKLLELNTIHDHNVTVLDYALSNDIGMCQIEKFELGQIGNYGECKITDKGQLCNMTTVDYLVENKEILPPHVIKIDVEGHEWQTIQGMTDTIKNNLPVIFYEAIHCDLTSIYDFLTGLAYKLYWFPVSNYNPNNYYKNQQNIFGQGGVVNIVAIPFHIDVKTNLPTVLDRNETWMTCVDRLQKANEQSN